MAITKEELEHISSLTALKFDEKDQENYISQLEDIFDFVSKLKELDVEGYEPMTHPIENKFLDAEEGQEDFENVEWLINNVKHDIKNNSIVIRSAIK